MLHSCILRLAERRVPKGFRFKLRTCNTKVNKMGKKTVNGGARLKESQAYTRKFGRAVASLFLNHYKKHGLLQPVRPPVDLEGSRALLRLGRNDDAWVDGELQGVEQLLRGGDIMKCMNACLAG